ncbi:hypothetical protein L6274_05805, partial [Candidatus Parcubacteria bacterium]|nr:hypothetical protein [Candidatus Parcubacteria bacterium]
EMILCMIFTVLLISPYVLAGNIIVKNGELNITDDFLINNSVFFVNSTSGKIGIGTATPTDALTILNSGAPQIRLGGGSSDAGIYIGAINEGSDENEGIFGFGVDFIDSGGVVTSWIARSTSAGIIRVDSGELNYYADTSLTPGNTFSPTAHFTIQSDGDVGIGTVSPQNKLDIDGHVKIGELGLTKDYPAVYFNSYYDGANLVYTTNDSAFAIFHFQDYDVLSLRYAGVGSAGNIPSWGDGLILDTSGNVGIGTDWSPNYKLDVQGTFRADSTASFGDVIQVDGAGNSYIGGNVGIGTTSPTAQLHISGGAVVSQGGFPTNPQLKLIGTGGNDSIIYFGTTSNARMIYVDENDSNKLKFTGGGATDLVTIDNTGNVGIGTTGPSAKLHVNGSTDGHVQSKLQNTNSGTGAYTTFVLGTDTSESYLMMKGSNNVAYSVPGNTLMLGSVAANPIAFYTNNAVKMFINGTSGNVGIGTTAPTAGKLQISNPDTTSNLIGIYLTNNDSDQYGLYIDGASQQGIALQGSADDSCYDGDGPAQCALNDYAEMMEFSELPEDGDLIIIDTENLGKLKVSTKPYDKLVVGIASEEPAMVIGSYGISIKGWDKNSTAKISPDGTEYYTYPLAISGRKLINVNNENGEVQPGDLLVTSSERGKAMRCEILELLGDDEIQDFEDLKENARRQKHNELCRNSAVAKAMTSAGEDGKVLALITLQ